MKSDAVIGRIRQWLLGLTLIGCLGTIVELFLAGHYKEIAQGIPFGLCLLGALSVGMVLWRPSRTTIWVLRGTMGLLGIGAVIGIAFHLLGNYEFEAELHPTATLLERLWNATQGASPMLAPGLLLFLALIALIATYIHPALQTLPVSRSHVR